MTSPRWIEIKAFELLQHANRARTRPSPLNSWILLCFCIMCALLSRKLKLAFGFDCYFFFSHTVHILSYCLCSVSANIVGRVEESTHDRGNMNQHRQNDLFCWALQLSASVCISSSALAAWWWICGDQMCCQRALEAQPAAGHAQQHLGAWLLPRPVFSLSSSAVPPSNNSECLEVIWKVNQYHCWK